MKSWSVFRWVVAVAVILLAAVSAIVAVILERERQQTIDQAKQSTAALALALEHQLAWTFQAVDLALGGAVDVLRITPGIAANNAAYRESLMRRVEELQPYVRAMFVIGADGWIAHDSDYPKTPRLNLGDRDYFQRHRGDPALVRWIAPPLQSRSGTGWFIAATRRVGLGNEFKGVAVAAVQPEHFEALYQRMNLGERRSISIYHRDGRVIARYPSDPGMLGKSMSEFPLFKQHIPAAPTGSYIASGGAFNYDRVVSYRVLERAPLVIAINQDLASTLEAWWQTVLWAAASMLVLALFVMVLATQFARRLRQRERAQRRAAQAEKLEALGLLTGGIAHDFSNVLGVVSTSLAILSRTARREQVDEAVATAQRAVRSGTGLIQRLLAFAKRQPLEVHAANLNQRIAEVAPLLRQAAGGGVLIDIDCEPDLPPCMLDETGFEVALLNLVVNARDAMNGQGRIMLTTYQCSTEGDALERGTGKRCVCLAVQDSGPGMPDEVRRRVLEPFFSTKGDKGTGLGLSQVYGFMRQITGELRIDTKPGHGTVVRMIFPAAQPPATDFSRTAEAKPPVSAPL